MKTVEVEFKVSSENKDKVNLLVQKLHLLFNEFDITVDDFTVSEIINFRLEDSDVSRS